MYGLKGYRTIGFKVTGFRACMYCNSESATQTSVSQSVYFCFPLGQFQDRS